MNISAVILTKDSDNRLREVLSQVSKVVDEIIIVDSYSQDNTISIAKEYECEIFQHDFRGYGQERNFGAEKASNNWVLAVDDDEVLTDRLVEELNTLKGGEGVSAYRIKRENYVFRKKMNEWYGTPIRLYNRQKAACETVDVHESIIVEHGEIEELDSTIKHFTYDTVDEYLEKLKKYTSLEVEGKKNKSSLYIQPIKIFLEHLIVKKLILDGHRGVYVSLMSAIYEYNVEMRKRVEGDK